jgi:hypothetical protein
MTLKANLDPEVELLVRCVDPAIDSDKSDRLQSLLAAEPDWDSVLELARSHGVVPSLNRALRSGYDRQVPEDILSTLHDWARSSALENLRLANELHTIADRFENEGIRWFVFKGPVLAASAYGALTHRTFTDLDLLVHPEDVTRAVDILEHAGYEHQTDAPRLDDSMLLGGPFTKSLVPEYTLERSGAEIEVRCSVGDPDRPFGLGFEGLWSRRTTVEVSGQDVPSFSPEDRVLALAFHGTKHNWYLLKWICDFGAAVTSPDIDWEQVVELAERHGNERKVLVGMSLVQRLFENDVPPKFEHRLRVDDHVTELASQVIHEMAAGPPTSPSQGESTIFNLKASEARRDRLRILLSNRALRPSGYVYNRLPLPGALHPLYYLTVPFRSVAVLGLKVVRPLKER